MTNPLLVFNGVDVDSGEYLLPPMPPRDFAQLVVGLPRDAETKARINMLKAWLASRQQSHLGVIADVDPCNVAETGWGVIFPYGSDPRIREALGPLLNLRRKQATEQGDYYREYVNENAFRPNDSATSWLARQGASATSPANPAKVPYYLMIVADPQTIPYRFQYELDVQYAVGRIYFDSLAEYDQYARSVVAAETSAPIDRPRAVFFGVQNRDDPATSLSATELVEPLASALPQDQKNKEKKWRDVPTWDVSSVLREEATKKKLTQLLGGEETPNLLFTASHGLGGFKPGDPRQVLQQGALVCQEWAGPIEGRGRPVSADSFFSAEDVSETARLGGLITFHFACYGAGTPQMDDFSQQAFRKPSEIAPRAFVAGLPRRLLGHPRGGAVAVVGHVERAWGYSFLEQGDGSQFVRQIDVYRSALTELMQGCRIGRAMEYFNERFAAVSVGLNQQLEDISYGKQVDELLVANLWTTNNDARNYVILGDPAVRLYVGNRVAGQEDRDGITAIQSERLTIAASTLPTKSQEATGGGGEAMSIPKGQQPTSDDAAPAASSSVRKTSELISEDSGAVASASSALESAQNDVALTLGQITGRFLDSIQSTIANIGSLEVRTYVSDSMENLASDGRQFADTAHLRAVTRIDPNGNTDTCIAETEGGIDDSLSSMHLSMVGKAQDHQARMLKRVVSAATELLQALETLNEKQRPGT
jgi:hypothetical protein